VELNPGPYWADSRKATGRGASLLTCGDVEANPGPETTSRSSSSLSRKDKSRKTSSSTQQPEPFGSVVDIAPIDVITTDYYQNLANVYDGAVEMAIDFPTSNPTSTTPNCDNPPVVRPTLPQRGPRTDLLPPPSPNPVSMSPGADDNRARSNRHNAALACPVAGCHAYNYHMTRETLLRHLSRHVVAGEAIPTAALDVVGHFVCTPCRHLVKIDCVCFLCWKEPTNNGSKVGDNHRGY
jgi:hypothetical protein